jgi:cyclic-di-GMP-binding protein
LNAFPPFVNPVNAGAWLDTLTGVPLHAAGTHLMHGLQAFNRGLDPTSEQHLVALLRIDEGMQTVLEDYRLTALTNPGLINGKPNLLWNDLYTIYELTLRAYHQFVASQLQSSDAGSTRANLALVVGRSLANLLNQAKIGYFAHKPLSGKGWKLAHSLFAIAEAGSFQDREISLYERPEPLKASCADLYVRILLLGTLNTGVLNARRIEIASGWLAEWAASVALEKTYVPETQLYFVRLTDEVGTRPCLYAEHGSQCLYLATEALSLQIERTKLAVREGDIVAPLGLRTIIPPVEYSILLDYLQRLWSPGRAEKDLRGNLRRYDHGKQIDVIRGLGDLCRIAKREYESQSDISAEPPEMSPGEALEFAVYGFITERTRARKLSMETTQELTRGVEPWRVHDHSRTGYGAIVPEASGPRPQVGTLVGLRAVNERRWTVGALVRALTIGDNDGVFVGIEILSSAPVIVALGETDASLAVTGSFRLPANLETQWALFLPGDQSRGSADSLVVDATMHAPRRNFTMRARNAAYRISLGNVLKQGDGWLRVGIEVLEKKD